jgi:hypothetical protein
MRQNKELEHDERLGFRRENCCVMTTCSGHIAADRAAISLPPHFAHIGASTFYIRESLRLDRIGIRIRDRQAAARGMERA